MRSALLAGLCLAFASPASAAIVATDFTGTIDSGGPFAAGTAFSGSVSYDNTAPATSGASGVAAFYDPISAPFVLTIGGTTYEGSPSEFGLLLNVSGGIDLFFFTATDNTGAYELLLERFDVFGPEYADGRPVVIPASVYASNRLTITRLSDGAVSMGAASFAGLEPGFSVPEPATWAMLIGGFGAIGGAMRRRASKESLASSPDNRGVVS